MNIGSLDTRCRIEQKSVSTDATYGTEVVTWVVLETVWCQIQDELPSKTEFTANDLSMNVTRSRVRMRFRRDIDSSMRLVIMRPTAVVYRIVSGVAEIGKKEGIEVMVERSSS